MATKAATPKPTVVVNGPKVTITGPFTVSVCDAISIQNEIGAGELDDALVSAFDKAGIDSYDYSMSNC